MITRKTQAVSSTAIWPYTPEPSPPLRPTNIRLPVTDDFKMSDDPPSSRPISVLSKREGAFSPGFRPTLEDVLNNRAPAPYTLAAYTAFLSQQHCLETLEFVTESKKYAAKFDEAAANLAGMPLNTDTDDGFELMQDWLRLLEIYVKPGAPREINLPAEERDDLLDYPFEPKPPPPEALDPSVKRMNDLMSDSIFIPFCNSVKAATPAQTYKSLAEYANRDSHERSRLTFQETMPSSHRRQNSRRRRSPPTTSAASFEPPRSPPPHRNAAPSALTAALTRTSSGRLSTHISHSSAASESAMTDESSGGVSPAGGERESFMSPPTTPPQSDMAVHHTSSHGPSISQKTSRSESTGWKKMGMKFFGGTGGAKKKR